jgi:membrane-bound lytic murein transglycosylase D
LNKTSLPRRFANAALLSALLIPSVSLQAQVPQQSYLRNTPSEIERDDPRVNKIIEDAEKHFKLGKMNLDDHKRQAAREEFDKAVDVVLESGMDVRSNPRLNRYYVELVERVYREEVPQNVPAARPAQNGVSYQTVAQTDAPQPAPVEVGFVDQKFEPSPLDDLRTLKLDEKEADVSADDVAKLQNEIKNTLDFSFTPHPLVQGFINYYQGRGRGTMETGLRRSGQYMQMARKIFREEGVPEDIVWLGQVESAWRPTARSWAAASGLWQFIPGTGSRFGLRQTAYVDERNSYEKATRASARYLKWLHNRFGNWELAMGAYNTGEGNIDRAINRAGGVRDFWTIYPYIAQETRNYVPNILAVILIAKNPEKYGFRNVQRMSPLAYDTVSVPSATSLQLVAALTDSSVDNIRALNPELRRDSTPPGEPYLLRVPPKRGHQMVALLKRIPADRRNQMARVVQAAPGENWETVASRSGVSAASLQQWNAGVDLAKGGTLIVPAGGVVRTIKNYERPNSAAPAGASLKSHTAKRGETVAQIAARYGASVAEVAKINGVTPDEPLAAGRQIRVPQGNGAAPAAPARRR